MTGYSEVIGADWNAPLGIGRRRSVDLSCPCRLQRLGQKERNQPVPLPNLFILGPRPPLTIVTTWHMLLFRSQESAKDRLAVGPPEKRQCSQEGKRKGQMSSCCFGAILRQSCVFFPLSVSFLSNRNSRPQPLSIHILPKPALANPFESHTSEKSHINIKTSGFKPHRDTFLQHAFSQPLWNHILLKKGHGGEGSTRNANRRRHASDFAFRISSFELGRAPIFPVLSWLVPPEHSAKEHSVRMSRP
jgi:hypothetical protein